MTGQPIGLRLSNHTDISLIPSKGNLRVDVNLEEPIRVASPTRINLEEP